MIPCQRFEYTKHWKNHNKTAIFYLCDLEYRREAREVCRADRTHRGGVCLFTPWYANEYCGENTSLRTLRRKAAQYWEQQERGESQSIEKTQVCTHGQYSMEKTQVCTHGHPPLVCGCNELIRKGRSSTRKHCPAKPTVLGNLPIFIQPIFLNHYWCQGVDMQAFLGNTNLLWHFTIFTHFIPPIEALPGNAHFPGHLYSVLPVLPFSWLIRNGRGWIRKPYFKKFLPPWPFS